MTTQDKIEALQEIREKVSRQIEALTRLLGEDSDAVKAMDKALEAIESELRGGAHD